MAFTDNIYLTIVETQDKGTRTGKVECFCNLHKHDYEVNVQGTKMIQSHKAITIFSTDYSRSQTGVKFCDW